MRMARMSPERREEKFALMRARQQFLEEARQKGAALRAPSADTLRRREKVKLIPAHLDMYRVKEVAQMLGVSGKTVQRWFWDRAVKVHGPGGQHRRKVTLLISRAVLEDWMRERT